MLTAIPTAHQPPEKIHSATGPRKTSGIFLVVMALDACACRQPAREPVTLSYFRLGWAQPDELPTAEGLSRIPLTALRDRVSRGAVLLAGRPA